jgi:hypothetical protein
VSHVSTVNTTMFALFRRSIPPDSLPNFLSTCDSLERFILIRSCERSSSSSVGFWPEYIEGGGWFD